MLFICRLTLFFLLHEPKLSRPTDCNDRTEDVCTVDSICQYDFLNTHQCYQDDDSQPCDALAGNNCRGPRCDLGVTGCHTAECRDIPLMYCGTYGSLVCDLDDNEFVCKPKGAPAPCSYYDNYDEYCNSSRCQWDAIGLVCKEQGDVWKEMARAPKMLIQHCPFIPVVEQARVRWLATGMSLETAASAIRSACTRSKRPAACSVTLTAAARQ